MAIKSGRQRIDSIRSSGSNTIESLYAGKSSKFISLKCYNKYYLLTFGAKKQKKFKEAEALYQELVKSSKGLLRCEITIHKGYLKKNGLTMARDLTAKVIRRHFYNKLGMVMLGTTKLLPVQDLNGLTNQQRLVYSHWSEGGDVSSILLKQAFERVCKKLLDKGIDIRQPYTDGVKGKSLKSYLSSKNIVDAPDFLLGTHWYFDPKKKLPRK